MSKKRLFLVLFGLLLAAVLLYQLPPIQRRLSWRIDLARTYLRGILQPAGPVPTARPVTPLAETSTATHAPQPTPTGNQPTANPTATPTPLPPSVQLTKPSYEAQGANNCGPATLALALRMFGWKGSQYDISGIIKPVEQDRNVNLSEMIYYVRNHAGWLRAEYRVNGNLSLLKRLLAAGFPVIIEETFYFRGPYWPNDDLWAAHYLLLTGYDDATQSFTTQDSYEGPDQQVGYERLMQNWESFNYVYMLVYLPEQESQLRTILGPDWDPDVNRQRALSASQTATTNHPSDAFAWFNLGTNLVASERYAEAAQAYDQARDLGLPQRMLRYQFGPFIAYFQSNRIDDLLTLTKYALQRTPNSEEALLWHGWALYRQGDKTSAMADWNKALQARPGYADAQYALNYATQNP
jgi:tetratricopeptide (TPR) repeat protein